MYSNARSRATVNETYRDNFLIQVRLFQGSELSPLLLIIVLEALFVDLRSRCPEELLYANDFTLASETLEVLK